MTGNENNPNMSSRQTRALAAVMAKIALREPGTNEPLDREEMVVLDGISSGKSVKELSSELYCLSARNVKRRYYKPILTKLGALNMVHATTLAIEGGLLDGPESISLADRVALPPGRRDILQLTSLGASKLEIATLLGISPITVSDQTYAIYDTLNVKTPEHAVREAHNRGIETWHRPQPSKAL